QRAGLGLRDRRHARHAARPDGGDPHFRAEQGALVRDPGRPAAARHLPGPRGVSPAPSFWLTRFVLLRLLGLVYFFAFLSLATQVLPLLGSHGLLPVPLFLERVGRHFGSPVEGFLQLPSLFWIDASDATLLAAAWAGVIL